ncbi:RNA polymerase III subunit C82, partial [Coemansia aciculifera]
MYTQQIGLCKQLVREHYGPIIEAVVAVLIREGRLPFHLIVRQTSLSPRNVRQSLAVLIQHSIVSHASAKDGPRIVPFYSVNLKSILRLQRTGLYLALVEERTGSDGLAIFRAIMINGFMTIGGIRQALKVSDMDSAAKLRFNAAVAKLVRDRYIIAVNTVDTVTK